MFGRKNSGKAPAEIESALFVLRAVSPAMHERAVRYVMDGSEPGLPAELAAAPDDDYFLLLNRPGDVARFHWGSQPVAPLIAKAGKGWTEAKALAAEKSLYEHIDVLTPDQVVRFARLHVATRRMPQPRMTRLGPDWLACLLLDAVQPVNWQSFPPQIPPEHLMHSHRALWTPALLESLLAADRLDEGGSATDDDVQVILANLFDRVEVTAQHWARYALDALTHLDGLPEYVLTYRETLASLVPGFSAAGKRELAAFLQFTPSLVEPLSDIVLALVQDGSKQVRADARRLISSLPAAQQLTMLEPLLLTAPMSAMPDLLVATGQLPGGGDAIDRAVAASAGLKGAAGARRRDALRTAGVRSTAIAAPPETVIEIPPYVRPAEEPLGDEFVRTLLERVASAKASLDSASLDPEIQATEWGRRHLKQNREIAAILGRFGESHARQVAAYLSHGGKAPDALDVLTANQVRSAITGLTVFQGMRLSVERIRHNKWRAGSVYWHDIAQSMGGQLEGDLRMFADAAAEAGYANADDQVAELVFPRWGTGLEDYAPEHLWPFFAERPHILRQMLNMGPGTMRNGDVGTNDTGTALRVLGMMPDIPTEFVARVTQLALGEGKTNRVAAQMLLEKRPGVIELAGGALADAKLEIRATAAVWLARIGDPVAIPALRKALAKEKREVVRAALLSALEQLGDDISKDLSPAKLAAEASAGLKGGMPAAQSWFPVQALPAVKWASNGKAVPSEVLQWWLALAVKLKDPSGGGIIGRYLSLLDPESRERLGDFVLSSWIAQDIRHPSDAEARAYAKAEAPGNYASWQKSVKQYPQLYSEIAMARYTVEDWYEHLRRVKAESYVGSAINEKGLLALASGTRGSTLVQTVQRFMKDHYLKRTQVEALLSVIAASDDLGATQLLLATARRHRTTSVLNRARYLVAELAERRGWTADELADRTIPTAGFDDDGVLRLSYGDREFLGRITPEQGIELSDANGRVLKALPAPRVDESAELASEAKAQLSASKKELKQQLGMQAGRLYEAMCAERLCTVADFREFLAGHPLMSRLIARLIWRVKADAEAGHGILFRPDGTGAFLDAEDADVDLPADGYVQVAHSSLMSADEIAAWTGHLADYAVVPLFPQLGAQVPEFRGEHVEFIDRRGRLTDTFTVRGLATKRGYRRGAGEDGGWFGEYLKDFTSLGIQVVLGFTGNTLPEENRPASVTTLAYRRLGRGARVVTLGEVPPVLLAESHADYVAVSGQGEFDPDWEKKSGW